MVGEVCLVCPVGDNNTMMVNVTVATDMSSVYIQFVTLKKGQYKWTIRYGPVHMDQYIWASRYCFVLTEVFIYSVNTLFVFFFLGFYFNQMYVVLMHTSWTCLCYNRVLLCFRAVMLWRLPVLAEPQLPRPLRSLSSFWKVILHLKKIIICGFLAGKKCSEIMYQKMCPCASWFLKQVMCSWCTVIVGVSSGQIQIHPHCFLHSRFGREMRNTKSK